MQSEVVNSVIARLEQLLEAGSLVRWEVMATAYGWDICVAYPSCRESGLSADIHREAIGRHEPNACALADEFFSYLAQLTQPGEDPC